MIHQTFPESKVDIDLENESINIYPQSNGTVRSIGYKSLAGLIQVIKRADRNCKKYGYKTKLVITLPVDPNEKRVFRYLSKKFDL